MSAVRQCLTLAIVAVIYLLGMVLRFVSPMPLEVTVQEVDE